MSTTLAIQNVKATVAWDYEQTNSFGTNSTNVSSMSFAPANLTNGSGAGKAQVLYVSQQVITSGSTLSLEITTSGALHDLYGNTINFADVKGIFIQHLTTTATGTVEISGTFASNSGSFLSGTTPKLLLLPGGCFFLANSGGTGYTVTASTGDTLTIKNNDAASITVNIALYGE